MTNFLFFIFLPGGSEWIIILFAIILLFGGRKIPELMRGLGKGIREFNAAKDNIRDELETGMRNDDKRDAASSK
ncbi:MAG: twin-arginine translocase TatA/TatE family subunit [Chitinophagales bacterium]|nr:twin-arginine translocase TatA/TatE family subunit [Bacteroidota bacterium]MCB9042881.1 twin-arginine translocase TatA/TatE family subunit [Chitinophagales bacterium]